MIANEATEAAEYLAEAEFRGLTFSQHGDVLQVSPRNAITDADREAIPQHKPAILTILAAREARRLMLSEMECEAWHPEPPEGAEIAVMDRWGRTPSHGKAMQEPYMWCWIGGPTWYYLHEHPLPKEVLSKYQPQLKESHENEQEPTERPD